MSSISKVADRIRKLLSLSESANANEAAAAAARAQELLQQHKLSMADVAADYDGDEIVKVPLGAKGFKAMWRFVLATNAARAFFCECIGLRIGPRRKVVLLGRRSDTEIATHVFKFLVSEIERLSEVYAHATLCDRSQKLSFIQGATMAVVHSLQHRTQDFKASSETALTVVRRSEDELRAYAQKHFGEPRPITSDASVRNLQSFEDGQAEGAKIPIPGRTNFLSGEVVEKPSVK